MIVDDHIVFNPGSERNLISICLKNADKVVDVETAEIYPEHFSVSGHKYIFMAITYLFSKKVKPTPLTILEVLSTEQSKQSVEELGGIDYLCLLEESNVPTENLPIFINKIKQSYTRRNLINLSKDIYSFAKSDNAETLNPTEILSYVESKMSDLNNNTKHNEESYKMGDETEMILTKRAETPTKVAGIEVGMEQYDKATNGARDGDLIIVCAESKTGKSVLLTNWATKIGIKDQEPILYIDTEMSNREQEDRLLAILTGIPVFEIITGMYVLDTENGLASNKIERLKKAREELNLGNYYHIYLPQFTAEKVMSVARKFQMQFGIKALFFDYIKIPSNQGGGNQKEFIQLGYVASALKDIAGILKIPVFSACQMNRDDYGGDNSPDASRIGGSYRILQLASKLIFLTNKSEKRIARDGERNGNQQLWIKYQRNGESDCPPINLMFNKPIVTQTEV